LQKQCQKEQLDSEFTCASKWFYQEQNCNKLETETGLALSNSMALTSTTENGQCNRSSWHNNLFILSWIIPLVNTYRQIKISSG
jgi:hypothetical protein